MINTVQYTRLNHSCKRHRKNQAQQLLQSLLLTNPSTTVVTAACRTHACSCDASQLPKQDELQHSARCNSHKP